MRYSEEELTNEGLSSLFKDNFTLAITAIRLAQNEVQADREVTMQSVLKELKMNPHLFNFEEYALANESHNQE